MQGLRPLQDENSGLAATRTFSGKAFGGEEGRTALGPMKTPKAGIPPSARKALGNITNKGLEASNILPGKTPAGSVARKALGNLTNAAAPSSNAQAATKSQQLEDRINKLAQDGVEKLAGKGWDDLEKEREVRAEEEIVQKVSAMAALGRRNLPTFYPDWVRFFPFD